MVREMEKQQKFNLAYDTLVEELWNQNQELYIIFQTLEQEQKDKVIWEILDNYAVSLDPDKEFPISALQTITHLIDSEVQETIPNLYPWYRYPISLLNCEESITISELKDLKHLLEEIKRRQIFHSLSYFHDLLISCLQTLDRQLENRKAER